ncbi:MAG: CHRD domain-containing protein [Alphaproteobacteria bacterium]|nr:CHRD domain-containing protein [Alphaproteobacteria bacterium]MBU1515422.1 CHRD domain-containing protein [Alphaproteobacteria bacterium]MBU2092943.1 CHRD domain-containing protein [Alphaproteobacteria bacterium]MBU2154218.1 CHRD domain-containing protein [Alphaproteobacteria bacterium]MBU2307247.1 CHRD domain-containing protein [Alphaproteobacteria bacterium]
MNKSAFIAALAVVGLAATPALAETLSAHLGGAGSPDTDGAGHATFKIDTAKNEVCYTVMVEKIGAATAAHVHRGAAGANGPPVVPMKAPDAAGKTEGCATVDAAVIKDILANPAGFYVNVHNAEFPGGAIRGQLMK